MIDLFNYEIHEWINEAKTEFRLKGASTEQPPVRIISIGAFRRRLSLTEKVAIETSTDPVLKVIEKDLQSSTFVDLDFPQTVEGIQYLAQQGILTPERVTEVLADGDASEQPKQ